MGIIIMTVGRRFPEGFALREVLWLWLCNFEGTTPTRAVSSFPLLTLYYSNAMPCYPLLITLHKSDAGLRFEASNVLTESMECIHIYIQLAHVSWRREARATGPSTRSPFWPQNLGARAYVGKVAGAAGKASYKRAGSFPRVEDSPFASPTVS